MKKFKKLTLSAETIRTLSAVELKPVAGGITQLGCQATQGWTVCLCASDYPNSCPCILTAQCEPSYRQCG